MEYTKSVFPVNMHYTALAVPFVDGARVYTGMEFRANLKRYRKAKNWKQADLAEALDIAQPTIQRWEAGKREPSLDDLNKLARVLEVTVADLFRDEPEDPIPSAEDIARMVQQAMSELPVGTAFGDYPEAVASSLHAQLKQYRAAGGFRRDSDRASARDTDAQSPETTTRSGREAARTP